MNTKKSKVRLWSVLTALTAILTIAAIVGNMIANQYATTLNVALNASTYKIIKGNTTEDTEYFKAGFASDEEREAYEAELCATVEAEGAALLMNNNNALPLAADAKVSTFSSSSAWMSSMLSEMVPPGLAMKSTASRRPVSCGSAIPSALTPARPRPRKTAS